MACLGRNVLTQNHIAAHAEMTFSLAKVAAGRCVNQPRTNAIYPKVQLPAHP
ncbi:hypothetical protein FBY03_12337 [Pseudomonas sp. SJZ079]|nr:hypothetical protein FBY03_12337 [Pseudomonas sp. SJZ079]